MASRRSALCSLVYLLLTASAQAQDDSCLRRTIPISVIEKTKTDWPAKGLVAGDLRGVFQGKPVHILSVTEDVRPLRIIILLDASSSMLETEREAKWHLALFASDIIRLVKDTGGFALTLSPEGPTDWPIYTYYTSWKEMLSRLDFSVQAQLRQISQFYTLEVALPREVDKPRELLLTFAKPREEPGAIEV
jgi:hypothetical protein